MPYKSKILKNANAVYQQPPKMSQFYMGFSSVNPANVNSRLYDFDLIKQDFLNHFNTRKGERLMKPEFGTIIWDLLMEPLTERVHDLLLQDVTTICNSDPRVAPLQINVSDYATGYLVEITLQLVGTDQSSNLRLSFDQEIGLQVQ
jgi:phage baseplate assembly protein W